MHAAQRQHRRVFCSKASTLAVSSWFSAAHCWPVYYFWQELGQAEVLQQQACFLPTSSDGVPVIGRLPGLDNAYIATAHSCW